MDERQQRIAMSQGSDILSLLFISAFQTFHNELCTLRQIHPLSDGRDRKNVRIGEFISYEWSLKFNESERSEQ